MSKPLSERQRRFVEAYMGRAAGNATEAARIAGYKQPNTQGPRLLVNDGILNAIAERAREDPAIMDRAALQLFWTTIARKGTEATRDRLAASKLLGKSQGQFITKHEHSGHVDATVKAVLESSPAETEDRVVEALRADPDLWARIQARVGDREDWDSTEGKG